MQPTMRPETRPMTFKFKNIGPIKSANLEVGDLTVIAGRNNTGKTYLVYTLYGFLTMWDTWPGPLSYTQEPSDSTSSASSTNRNIFREIVGQFSDKRDAVVAVDRNALNRERSNLMKALGRSFSSDALSTVFSSPSDAFQRASIAVDLKSEFPERSQPVEMRVRSDEILVMKYNEGKIVTTLNSSAQGKGEPPDIFHHLWPLYLRFLFPELPTDPFVLSAERFGISLFYKELDFTKNQLVDLLQKIGDRKKRDRSFPFFLMDQSLSRYALPIKHNIDFTRSVADFQKQRSDVYEDNLFNEIRRLMSGYYKASRENIEFRSVSRGENRFSIPLHLASSSARGLSDLYFFLRHVARRDRLLIIDEPEGHLDTANQILLARLLARMVRAGLRIVVTTHSDYLVKEINNLVMLSCSFPDKAKVIRKLRYVQEDGLPPESIRAYIAEEGGLKKCTVDRFGIDMPIFDDTIDRINDVASELAARMGGESVGTV